MTANKVTKSTDKSNCMKISNLLNPIKAQKTKNVKMPRKKTVPANEINEYFDLLAYCNSKLGGNFEPLSDAEIKECYDDQVVNKRRSQVIKMYLFYFKVFPPSTGLMECTEKRIENGDMEYYWFLRWSSDNKFFKRQENRKRK